MAKVNDLADYGGVWVKSDPVNRDALVITRDGMLMSSGVSCGAKSIANMLLNVMSENAEICEGIKLAAKHYDSLADVLRKDKAKPDRKKDLS